MQRTDTIPEDYPAMIAVQTISQLFEHQFGADNPVECYFLRWQLTSNFNALSWYLKERLKLGFNAQAIISEQEFLALSQSDSPEIQEARAQIADDIEQTKKPGKAAKLYVEHGVTQADRMQGFPAVFHKDGLINEADGRVLCTYSGSPTLAMRQQDAQYNEWVITLNPVAKAFSLGQHTLSRHSTLIHRGDFSLNPKDPPRLRLFIDEP